MPSLKEFVFAVHKLKAGSLSGPKIDLLISPALSWKLLSEVTKRENSHSLSKQVHDVHVVML